MSHRKGLGMSSEMADSIFFWANWALVFALGIGVVATFAVVASGIEKDKASKLELATANENAALANERAAGLAKETEALRAANLKLEEALAPRRITGEQRVALVEAFSKFSGHKVQVSSYALDAEGLLLGHALIEIMQEAGVSASGLTTVVPITTLRAGIHVTAPNEAGRVVAHGIAAAIGQNTPLTVTYNPGIPTDEAEIELEGTGNLAKFAALVLVGVKPVKKDAATEISP